MKKILLINLIIFSFLFSEEIKEENIKNNVMPNSVQSIIKKQVENTVEIIKNPKKTEEKKKEIEFSVLSDISKKQKEINNTDLDENVNIKEITNDEIKEKYIYFNDVIQIINEESFINNSKNEKELLDINLKIEANKNYNNNLAVNRDKIKIALINNRINFNNMINDLIKKRKMYVSKQEMILVIESANDKILNDENLKNIKPEIEKLKQNQKNNEKIYNPNNIELKILENYKEYLEERTTFLLLNKFLKENISKITKTNFLIDKVNIDYIVNIINNVKIIDNLNPLLLYYTKVTFGNVFVGLVFVFFIMASYIVIFPLLMRFLNKIRNKDIKEGVFRDFIYQSLNRPIFILLILISIEVFITIIHNKQFDIDKTIILISSLKMFVIIWAIYNLFTNYFDFYSEIIFTKYPNMRREMILFVKRIFVIILFIVGIIIILSNLGFNVNRLLGGLGILGVGFSLAFRDTFANFLGSINILFDKPFSPGDLISISNDIEGTVIDIRMRTTRIRTFDNTELTIPNSNLSNASIKNYGRRKIGRRIKFDISITYESPKEGFKNLIKDIRQMLIENPDIANETDFCDLTEFKTQNLLDTENLIGIKRSQNVSFTEFTNNAKLINIYCFSKSVEWEDWREIQEKLLFKIEELVEKNDCKFAYPTTTNYNK